MDMLRDNREVDTKAAFSVLAIFYIKKRNSCFSFSL